MPLHNKEAAPLLSQAFDPDDNDTFWIAWDSILGNQRITSSEWILPDGWESIIERVNKSFVDSETGEEYFKANMVRLKTTQRDGEYHIVNRILTDQGNQIDRGFIVQVESRL